MVRKRWLIGGMSYWTRRRPRCSSRLDFGRFCSAICCIKSELNGIFNNVRHGCSATVSLPPLVKSDELSQKFCWKKTQRVFYFKNENSDFGHYTSVVCCLKSELNGVLKMFVMDARLFLWLHWWNPMNFHRNFVEKKAQRTCFLLQQWKCWFRTSSIRFRPLHERHLLPQKWTKWSFKNVRNGCSATVSLAPLVKSNELSRKFCWKKTQPTWFLF